MKKINPVNNNGSIQIKFNLRGITYRCTPIPGAKFDSESDLEATQAICNQISLDIRNDCFDRDDRNLAKYLRIPKRSSNVKFGGLLDLYEYWYENILDRKAYTKAGRYRDVLAQIKRLKPRLYDTDWLEIGIANSTYNNRLVVMKMCFRDCLKKDLINNNPWRDIKSRRVDQKFIKPFSLQERRAIIKVLESENNHYTDFVKFLFITGCRFSEAIGLKWDKVFYEEGYILIDQSLSIDLSEGKFKRKIKDRKNGGFICFPIDSNLKEILENQSRDSEYIFMSSRGRVISIQTFRKFCWEPCLEKAGVEYRRIHIIRHTFGSEGVKQGKPLSDIAALMGDKIETIVNNYTHVIGTPKAPEIF